MFSDIEGTEHEILRAKETGTDQIIEESPTRYIENDEINDDDSQVVLEELDPITSKKRRKKKIIAWFLVFFISLFIGLLSFYGMGVFLASFGLGVVAYYTLSGLSAFFSVAIEGHEYWESIVEAFDIIQNKEDRRLKIFLAVLATVGAVGCLFLTASQLIPTLAALAIILGAVGFPFLIWTIAAIAAIAYFFLAFKALYDLFGKDGTLRENFKNLFSHDQHIVKKVAAVLLVVLTTALIITATIITGGIWWHLVRGLSHVPWCKLAMSICTVFTVIGQAIFSFCSSIDSLTAILNFSKIWNAIKSFIKNANDQDKADNIRWNESCFRWLCRAALTCVISTTFIAHLTAMAVIGSSFKSMKIWCVTISSKIAMLFQETTEGLTDFNFVKESVMEEPEGLLPYITFLLVVPLVVVAWSIITVAWLVEAVAWSFSSIFSNCFCSCRSPWKLSTPPLGLGASNGRGWVILLGSYSHLMVIQSRMI